MLRRSPFRPRCSRRRKKNRDGSPGFRQARPATDTRPAAPKSKHNELFHLLLGLVGETGEIAEKAKKIVRDRDSDFSQWDAANLKKELGDSLWYIAVIADYFGIPLDDVAQLNIAKLADRQRRGVIGGRGDGR